MWQQHFAKLRALLNPEMEGNCLKLFSRRNCTGGQDDKWTSKCGCFSVKLLIMHAFAPFLFPDMPNKAFIQFTHSSAVIPLVTRNHQGYCQGAVTAKSSLFKCIRWSAWCIIRGCCIHECNCCNKCTLTLPSLAPQQSLLCCLTKAIQSPTMRVISSLGGEKYQNIPKTLHPKHCITLTTLESAFDLFCYKNPVIFSACSEIPFPSQHLTKQSEQWSCQIKIHVFNLSSKRGKW